VIVVEIALHRPDLVEVRLEAQKTNCRK
jgi:hypothetical protein